MKHIDFTLKSGVSFGNTTPDYTTFTTRELFDGTGDEAVEYAYEKFRAYMDGITNNPLCHCSDTTSLESAKITGILVGTVGYLMDVNKYMIFQLTVSINN